MGEGIRVEDSGKSKSRKMVETTRRKREEAICVAVKLRWFVAEEFRSRKKLAKML